MKKTRREVRSVQLCWIGEWPPALKSQSKLLLINVFSEYFPPDAEQGVYEFPRLTLLGFDTNEPQVRRLAQLGLKVFCITPYHLQRINIDLLGFLTHLKTFSLNPYAYTGFFTFKIVIQMSPVVIR